jgi:hypothetical protein
MRHGIAFVVMCLVLGVATVRSTQAPPDAPGRLFAGSSLHAHNAYPEDGRWLDRIERALATGVRPIAIEQDLAWAAGPDGGGRSVLSHDVELRGDEPALADYFFSRVRPLMEAALAQPRPETWPLIVLHLDFKTNERAHHQAVWDLLGRHERWLTTVTRTADDRPQPFRLGPLLVLTENGAGQAAAFYDAVPVGERLRLFGTVPSARTTTSTDREVQAEAAIRTPVDQLIPSGATNYRRWVNFPWAVVERGGQAAAGPWTADDDARLKAIVDRAHSLGLWVRFYTLNGHPPEASLGWSTGYNFGTLAAVEPRWQAAIAAGVDFVATDQYEAFAGKLARR